MSISSLSSNIVRLQKELADISKKISTETKKETDHQKRILQIEKSITKNTSIGSLKSKMSEIQRKQNEIAKILQKKADLAKKEAEKTAKLLKLKQDLAKEEEKERKKIDEVEKRRQKEQIEFQRTLRAEIELTTQQTNRYKKDLTDNKLQIPEYDLFISHASEDKEDFVRPLAENLKKLGVKVWYDEFALKVGDSLRKSIDEGLIKSRYGTVVLSSSFFKKNWTEYELNSMVAKEMEGHKMILPIWHKVTKTEVINYSPSLADKVALNSSTNSIEEIAKLLAEVVIVDK